MPSQVSHHFWWQTTFIVCTNFVLCLIGKILSIDKELSKILGIVPEIIFRFDLTSVWEFIICQWYFRFCWFTSYQIKQKTKTYLNLAWSLSFLLSVGEIYTEQKDISFPRNSTNILNHKHNIKFLCLASVAAYYSFSTHICCARKRAFLIIFQTNGTQFEI